MYIGVENTPLALNFTRAAEGSRFFGSLPSNILYILGHYNVTQNFHHDGVTPVTFLENKNLHQFYNMLSTNHDSNGKEFVSTIEAFEWPVYGTQVRERKKERKKERKEGREEGRERRPRLYAAKKIAFRLCYFRLHSLVAS